jgi:KinB signaling pathway activation protein
VTIRNWVKMFWSTLFIGGATAAVVGLALAASDGEMFQWNVMEFGYNVLSMGMAGFMFSILSQMFFFAYMTLNFIARDMFRGPSTWKLIQIFFIVTVPFEIYMFMWNGSLTKFVLGFAVLLVLSLGTAYWKVKMTNSHAFIPSVFFMLVFTLVETAIAIQVSNDEATLLMASALITCNAWQLLRLHKIVKKIES